MFFSFATNKTAPRGETGKHGPPAQLRAEEEEGLPKEAATLLASTERLVTEIHLDPNLVKNKIAQVKYYNLILKKKFFCYSSFN